MVDAPAVPLLVAATAGSGKTRGLVQRIVRLIEDGAEPTRILAVTFSVKAAREMMERLHRQGCTDARVGTFHSLALQIVREECPEQHNWEIDDRDRYRICVKEAVSFKQMDWKSADVTHLLSYIGRCKANGARPDSADALALAQKLYRKRPTAGREPNLCKQAYQMAELIRRERCLRTFDDMMIDAVDALSDEDVRVRWASRWDHVLQDEGQDENWVQHQLGAYLAQYHRSYTVVGDPAQSVFGFRGADPSGLLTFEADWGARVVRMSSNYRCATSIVEVANRTLAAMPQHTHLGVVMQPVRTERGTVRAVEYTDFDDEGEQVTEQILESHEDGRAWKDHVVLYRTNAQSRGVEEAMLSARIPYIVLGGTNFYDRREVRDLVAYLRIAAGRGTSEDVRRSINTPFRFLGRAFVEGLTQLSLDDGVLTAVRSYVMQASGLQQRQRTSAISFCQLVESISEVIEAGKRDASSTRDTPAEIDARPSKILEHLVSDLRYNEWLTRDEGAESPENNRVSNVRELIRAAGRFPTVDELLDYVDDTVARSKRAKREFASSDVVTLCSIHRSKGLEWPCVFVIGVNEKILPHAHADDFDEERRLYYVACTRAADRLELSYVAQAALSTRVADLKPSQFLIESGALSSSTTQCPEAC